jgi:hypothetical protein
MRVLIPLIGALLMLTPASRAAVFQYHGTVETTRKGKTREVDAFLWVPPEAPRVRGVILAGMTLMEQHFVKDATIRRMCEAQQLAIVFMQCGLKGPDHQKTLDAFAAQCGYRELAAAPLVFVGHSAGGGPALECARATPDRCIALIQYRGGMPAKDAALPPGIPSVAMLGQFDEFWGTMRTEDGTESWERAVASMRNYRALGPDRLASLVVEPGAGHFAWSARNADYLALFIRKAVEARVPPDGPIDAGEPVRLKPVDPASGWLTGLDLKAAPIPCAPFDRYAGDKAGTSWHVDREMAEAAVAYHAGITGRKDQFIRWEDPCWVDAGARFFFTKPLFVGDGATLKVHPVFRDTIPGQYQGRGPTWPGAGGPCGHGTAPIRVRPVGGPLVATGPDTFRFEYDALSPATGRIRCTFLACSEGDETYRYTEHVGMMPRGFAGLGKGKAQAITFPEIPDMKADGEPVALNAVSDSGLRVGYYVAYGPAVVEDGRIRIAQLPRRAVYPIPVKVVACQFGSGKEPLVKTAAPVERAFRILK